MFRSFAVAAVVGVLAAAPGASGLAQQRAAVFVCTNPASGATWRIAIDYRGNTVDSYPADIGAGTISWHDKREDTYYALDRKSGDLRVSVGSSTGGWIRHDVCRPETAR